MGIGPVDLVVCNLYPFEKAVEEEKGWKELIEYIDIGGVTLMRAGAKNYESIAVLTNPDQYERFKINFQKGSGSTQKEYREELARTAF